MIVRIINKLSYIIHSYSVKKTLCALNSCGSNVSFGLKYTVIGEKYISIGNDFSTGAFFKLQAWDSYRGEMVDNIPQLIIGNDVSIMDNCQISCANKIIINDGCLMGDNVFITDNFHGEIDRNELMINPLKRKLFSKGGVYIGRNVWLGRNVCIMPGVSIGDGTIIAANAVVTHDIPEFSVAAGVPAKVISRKYL